MWNSCKQPKQTLQKLKWEKGIDLKQTFFSGCVFYSGRDTQCHSTVMTSPLPKQSWCSSKQFYGAGWGWIYVFIIFSGEINFVIRTWSVRGNEKHIQGRTMIDSGTSFSILAAGVFLKGGKLRWWWIQSRNVEIQPVKIQICSVRGSCKSQLSQFPAGIMRTLWDIYSFKSYTCWHNNCLFSTVILWLKYSHVFISYCLLVGRITQKC